MKLALGEEIARKDCNEEGLKVFQKKILFFFPTDWETESAEQ